MKIVVFIFFGAGAGHTKTMRTKTICLSLVTLSLFALAASASAAGRSTNMSTVNPYLHDSFNPISHENPAQTDAVDIVSGTKGRTLGTGDAKVLYTDIEASHHILKNKGGQQIFTRFLGLILISMGLQFVLTGLKDFMLG